MRYGVIADKGFLLLTGGVGSGKTTLLNTLLTMLQADIKACRLTVCLLNNPKLSRHEFFYFLGAKFGIRYDGNKGLFILKFSDLLEKYEKENRKLLLIIDEAQAFPIDLLEEIRLLSNHAEGRNVFSIFLVGQPELQEKLASSQLLPLRQRIGIRYHLAPLTREETSQYIVYRLQMAGAVKTSIFDEKAMDCIYEASQGTPRLINVICDHALILGFTREIYQISKEHVTECIEAIRLQGEKWPQISPPNESTDDKSIGHRDKGKKHTVAALVFLLTLILAGAGFFYFRPLQQWLEGMY